MSVYFIAPIGGGPIKIGRSQSVKSRFGTVIGWSPVELELLAHAPGAQAVEGYLHWRFRSLWQRCEWHSPSAELLGLIDETKATGKIPGAGPYLEWDLLGQSWPCCRSPAVFSLLEKHGVQRKELAAFLGIDHRSLYQWHGIAGRNVAPVVEFFRSRGIIISPMALRDVKPASAAA